MRALTHLSDEEELFRSTVARFARERLAPHVRQMDEAGAFRVDPSPVVPPSWDHGMNLVMPLTGLQLPRFGLYQVARRPGIPRAKGSSPVAAEDGSEPVALTLWREATRSVGV